jgi:hypothetical protein
MLALIIIISILGYFGIGVIIGRRLFIQALGDSPRTHLPYPHSRPNDPEPTTRYKQAQSLAIWSIFAWWLVWPVWAIQRPTPYELQEQRRQEMLTLEKEMKRIEKEYGLTFHGELIK